MAENQIQLMLNPGAYIGDKDSVNGFGPNKDFYVGHDNDFVAHKALLVQGLDDVEAASQDNAYSKIAYAKVKMRSDAVAKTHRPTQSIFTRSKRNFVVGGAGVGELLVEMFPGSIEKTKQSISRAEDDSRDKPSRARSEVGGIQSIQPYSYEDRVSFTLAEVTATEISRQRNPKGMAQSRQTAKEGGEVARNARADIESRLGHSVISSERASDHIRPIKEKSKAAELPFEDKEDK